MASRFLDLFRRSFDPNKPARKGRDVGDVVDATLIGRWPGPFQRVHDLVWVSEPKSHVRCVFEFQRMKGARFSACWGISIDFVPLTGRKGLVRKRTTKTAERDLTIDPIDLEGTIPVWCSFMHNEGDRRIQKVARASLEAAKADWATLSSLVDIVACFERRSKLTFQRFSLENYSQTHLAWGLVLVALGRSEEGERHLASYVEQIDIASDNLILLKAKRLAEAIAQTG
jgi:hypothetical protein